MTARLDRETAAAVAAEVVARRARGFRVRAICRQMGLTVGQVAGILHRAGATRPADNPVKRRSKSKAYPARKVAPERLPAARSVAASPFAAPAGKMRRARRAARFRRCEWIAGEPSADDRCKCGAPAAPGAGDPYCATHRALARLKPSRAEAGP